MAADMDHEYIRENNVTALYFLGKLSVEERNRFEGHFVDCQQCLDQLEVTGDFREVLKQVAKEDDSWSKDANWGPVPQRGRLAWLGGPGLWQQPRLLAYAAVLFAVSLTAVFFASTRYRRSELTQSQRLSDDWQRRYAEERQNRENLEKQLHASSNKTGDQNKSAPANRIAVPTTTPWIVLSLEFEKDPDFQSYRARLSNAQGQILWSAEHILPPPSDAIAISLPSNLLSKGDYSLALDGLTSTGHYVPAAHFSFRATAQK
jgi:hypothetical protein